MSNELTFSVVVPVCHGAGLLQQAVRSLREVDYPSDRFEILVPIAPGAVEEGASANRPPDEPQVRYVHSSRLGLAAQLNAACCLARGEVLAFIEDDCVVPPDWLKSIEDEMGRDPAAAVVGGVDRLGGDVGAFDVALDYVLNCFAGAAVPRTTGSMLARGYPKLWNMAVRRQAAEAAVLPGPEGRLQFFDERLAAHEDVDLCERIEQRGGRLVVAPALVVGHRREATLRSVVRRNFHMARECRRLGVHRLPHFVMSAMAGGGLALAATSPWVPSLRPVLLATAAGCAALLLACGAAGALARRDARVVPLVPVILAGLCAARIAGYIWPASHRGERA